MTRRTRILWTTAIAVALVMSRNDARLGAQAPAGQPAVSQSGIDLTALDKTADACTDFYQFACGGWIAKHPVPSDQPRYGRFEELQDRNNAILRGILEDAARAPASADVNTRKIGDYYGTCMDEAAIEAKGTTPLKQDLDRIAAIKSLADLPAVVGRMHTVGEGAFFGFGAAPDFKDASQYMLIFGQGGMGLPDRDYYLKDDQNAVKLREQYQRLIGGISGVGS